MKRTAELLGGHSEVTQDLSPRSQLLLVGQPAT